MIKKLFFVSIILCFLSGHATAQTFVRTSELFHRDGAHVGQLNIIQDLSIDTLISRYILINKKVSESSGYYGMEGYRIQIYNSSNRNAREESAKARAEFMSKFPNIISYPLFADPGYFKIRVGDFRSRTEAYRSFLIISKEFPNSDLVPDFINFPDLNTK